MRIAARIAGLALVISGAVPLGTNAAQPVVACVTDGTHFGVWQLHQLSMTVCTPGRASTPVFQYRLILVRDSDWVLEACNRSNQCTFRGGHSTPGAKPFGTIQAPPGGCPCTAYIGVERGIGYLVSKP